MAECPTHVWDRQGRESARAFAAFCHYRDMLPSQRTLAEATRQTGEKHERTLKRWSSDHNWIDRIRDFDAWKSREIAEREIDMAVEARARWAKQAQLLQTVAFKALWRRAKRIDELTSKGVLDEDEQAELKALEPGLSLVQRMLISGMDAERLSIGEPTEITRTDSFDQWMADLRKSRGLPAGESPFGTVN